MIAGGLERYSKQRSDQAKAKVGEGAEQDMEQILGCMWWGGLSTMEGNRVEDVLLIK